MYDVIYNLTRSKCHSKVNFRDLPECANFNAIWQKCEKSFHSLDLGTSKNFGTIPKKGAVQLPYEPRINEIIKYRKQYFHSYIKFSYIPLYVFRSGLKKKNLYVQKIEHPRLIDGLRRAYEKHFHTHNNK